MQVLASLASDEAKINFITEQQGPVEIIRIMKSHAGNPEVVRRGLMVLAKLVCDEKTAQRCAKQGAIETTIDAMNAYVSDNKMFVEALRTLANLSILADNAHLIASNAVTATLAGIERNADDQIFMWAAAAFITNLTIFETASRLLVEDGVIENFIGRVRDNLEYPGLLAKLIRAMANALLTAGEDAKLAVRKVKGLQTVREVLGMYPHNHELVKACETFIKKMTESARPRHQVATADIRSLREQIPPSFRNLMEAGFIARKFCRSARPRKRHIRIGNEFESLHWTDPTGRKPGHACPIQAIREVRAGTCTAELKRKSRLWRAAVPERSLAVFAEDNRRKPFQLCLECRSADEQKLWVEMIELLMKLHEPMGFSTA
eukprot:788959_1